MGRADAVSEDAVEEDGQLELVRDPAGDVPRCTLRARHVLRAERDERDNVGGADSRMRSLVPAQVDALLRTGHARQQGVDEIVLRPDEREDGPVVVDIRVNIEEVGMLAQRLGEGVDGRPVPSLGEVRNRFERQFHARTLGA